MVFDNIKNPTQLLNFMTKSINYGFVGKNGKKYTDIGSDEWNDWYLQCLVQTGEELLDSKIGTCWDQVELERLWFEKKNYIFKTFFCWFEVNKRNDFPTHTFLIFKNDDKWYWFEHAFEKYRGIHKFDTLDEAVEYVLEKHFEFALANNNKISKNDRNKLICYEYTKLLKHLSVDEYIDFVTSNVDGVIHLKKYD